MKNLFKMLPVLRLIISTLILLTLSAAAIADENHDPIGKGAENLPIFDAHMHYKEPAWGPYPVESVIEMMDESGVAMALVSSTPDDGTIMLYEFAPDRIVPELRPYHGEANSSNWTSIEGISCYLVERVTKYPHTRQLELNPDGNFEPGDDLCSKSAPISQKWKFNENVLQVTRYPQSAYLPIAVIT